ncbi:alpha/beta hydrolase [Ramlibacter tataouinensis]|uniref:alpha/beta hydrolase n=1 Tax=Ramlibacter tataouinensis TaxID=94132 RepID=UPI0022F3DB97|nr:alpha/beta hydrolase [Ramlibacter tataouinensis]WBY01892.1 alpha/beta hydrolase [Ramlibacter tataouinensis]
MTHAGLLSGLAPSPKLDGVAQPLFELFQPARSRRTAQGRLYEGNGQPVIVFPRQGTGPESTAPLHRTLQQAGFRPFDWGYGVNHGPRGMGLSRWLRKLEDCVIDAFEATQAPVTLLGWGLSGIYARELAKRANPLVRQVITLGTPFNTAADPQRRCRVLALLDSGPDRMPLSMRTGLRQRPPVPVTSIYSKNDTVVRWEQCVETETAESENIELSGVRHEGLAMHPRALEVITHRLAQPEGRWRPFAAAGRA